VEDELEMKGSDDSDSESDFEGETPPGSTSTNTDDSTASDQDFRVEGLSGCDSEDNSEEQTDSESTVRQASTLRTKKADKV
jgi:hypothetical protein